MPLAAAGALRRARFQHPAMGRGVKQRSWGRVGEMKGQSWCHSRAKGGARLEKQSPEEGIEVQQQQVWAESSAWRSQR